MQFDLLEFGAGYTTVLFKQLTENQVALEDGSGPALRLRERRRVLVVAVGPAARRSCPEIVLPQ
jgi:hypothetical protein